MSAVINAGVAVGDIFAVADVEQLWAEAERCEREGKRREKKQARSANEARDPSYVHPHAFTGKQRGEMAEAAFMAKAFSLGFGVAKPWGDSERYDFIVDVAQLGMEKRFWRVQVKSAHRAGEDGSYSFRLHTHSLEAYTPEQIDVLVAYVVPEDAWYVFPIKELGGLRSLKLFSGSRRKRSRFEKWREAWWVFGEGSRW
jgi:PD-(D/E)XK endonuclease